MEDRATSRQLHIQTHEDEEEVVDLDPHPFRKKFRWNSDDGLGFECEDILREVWWRSLFSHILNMFRCCRPRTTAEAMSSLRRKRAKIDKKQRAQQLWDIPDPALMEKVACDMLIKVINIDPKESKYEIRMKCKWKFRTLHGEERTETKLRVPGVRLPGLIVKVEESRIWKCMEGTQRSKHTMLWRGMSRFNISGFERFEMFDFPYDRQLISMDILDFVWRSEHSHGPDDFDFSMQVSSLHVQTVSVLPQWQRYPAIVEPVDAKFTTRSKKVGGAALEASPREGERKRYEYASRFKVRLRMERKSMFYVIQAFGLTVAITIASICPLFMPICDLGNRLGVYAAGMLTLTSFKYTIADHLPSVPYSNYFDWILFLQLVSVMGAALESVLVYKATKLREPHCFCKPKKECDSEAYGEEDFRKYVRRVEDVVCTILIIFWCGALYWAAQKQPKSWDYVLDHQEPQADHDEVECLGSKTEKKSILEVNKLLDGVNDSIRSIQERLARAHAEDVGGRDVESLSRELDKLHFSRTDWEGQLMSLMPSHHEGRSP